MHVCRIRPYGYRITCIQSVLVCMHVIHARVFVYVWLYVWLHMHACMYACYACTFNMHVCMDKCVNYELYVRFLVFKQR